MASKLRKIDEAGEVLVNLLNAGRITQAQYTARLRKLVERAEKVLARQS